MCSTSSYLARHRSRSRISCTSLLFGCRSVGHRSSRVAFSPLSRRSRFLSQKLGPNRKRMSATSLPQNGVLTLSGYGLRVWIEHGHLCAEDGVGSERRKVRLSRVAPRLKRLVVLGHSGAIS